MDNSTYEWIRVINSGRAFSHLLPTVLESSLKNYSENHFVQILRSHISKNDAVLEAGCGAAYSSFSLAFLGVKVTALDISEKIIKDLKKIRKHLNLKIPSNIDFIIGDIFNLNNLNRKFNLVFNHGVYEHWLSKKERYKILQNIASVLSDHGKIIVAVPNLKNPLFHAALSDNNVPAMFKFTLPQLIHEIEENGFKPIESGQLFVAPGFEQWLKWPLMTYPINFIEKVYLKLPLILRKSLAAHIYCVATLSKAD